ncbi:MAG: type II toxin-antitoxin system VapC family toxin [Calditrichaeota bacterium]|nr:MAG: type II toxin-antitoxin system VapC family toxin [Calditrichota bacterium]
MLIDTDVLIWYMKGNDRAFKLIEKLNGFFISAVTYIELVQGIRNKNELIELRKAIASWNTKIIFINEEISVKATFFIERFYLSHSLHLADSLIAATAMVNGLPLVTANDKHYRIIKEIQINKFRP